MQYPCGICNLDTVKKRSVFCPKCKKWYHADCENITKEMFATLDKNRNLAYTCKDCMKNPVVVEDDGISLKDEMRNQFTVLSNSLRVLAEDMKREQTEIKNKFDSVVVDIRKELSVNLKNIKDEVRNCNNLVKENDAANKKKFFELELQNHVLQHRLNRPDIIITGLADNIDDLNKIVVSLCFYLKVEIMPHDVLNVFYIRRKSAILVKFAQITTRDRIMSAYFKTKSLKKSDIVGGDDSNRIYLNDNYSPLAYKLFRMCWKLVKEKKIHYFSMINRENLKCKIKLLNGDTKTISFLECFELFNSDQ